MIILIHYQLLHLKLKTFNNQKPTSSSAESLHSSQTYLLCASWMASTLFITACCCLHLSCTESVSLSQHLNTSSGSSYGVGGGAVWASFGELYKQVSHCVWTFGKPIPLKNTSVSLFIFNFTSPTKRLVPNLLCFALWNGNVVAPLLFSFPSVQIGCG